MATAIDQLKPVSLDAACRKKERNPCYLRYRVNQDIKADNYSNM